MVKACTAVLHLTFSEWLSNSGLEQFKQKLLSDEIGVGEESWRADVKELDVDACRQVGMSVVQVTFEPLLPMPLDCLTHTFALLLPIFPLSPAAALPLSGEEVRPLGGPCDQLGIIVYWAVDHDSPVLYYRQY